MCEAFQRQKLDPARPQAPRRRAIRLFRSAQAFQVLDGVAIGSAGGIEILLVVHTSGEKRGQEEIRIISARKASRRERALYDSAH